MQVRAVVAASTAAGKRAIQQIKSEEMVGLSQAMQSSRGQAFREGQTAPHCDESCDS